MKKLYNIFLVLAIISTICMRFAYAPEKSPNNLFVDDVVTASLYGNKHIINKQGEIVATIESDAYDHTILGFRADGLAVYFTYDYYESGLPKMDFGAVNTKGEMVIAQEYDYISDFQNGIAAAAKNGKFGYIDTKGNTVIDFIYEDAWSFNDGSIAPVRIEKRYGYLNKKGEIVIERQFNEARPVVNGIAVATNGRLVKAWSEERGEYMETEKDYYIINDKTGKMITVVYDEVADFAENGFAAMREGVLYGYINQKGEEVIAPQFIEAGEFSEGLAPVKTQDEKWCYINERGEIVLEFEKAMKLGSFYNGLAQIVNEQREHGYINTDGEMVIEQKFRYNGGERKFYDDGYAVVEKTIGKYGVIDKQGNFVIEPIYDSIN